MKALLTFIVSILIVIPCYAQQEGIQVSGKIENSKNNWLVFRKNGTNVLTGDRERIRYKTTINQKGDFEIFLPTTEINEWIIEVDDVIKLVDFGLKGNFKVTITANNEYSVSVFDEAGDDFNFKSDVAKTVSKG